MKIDFHDNDALIWTWPLTLSAAALGVALRATLVATVTVIVLAALDIASWS